MRESVLRGDIFSDNLTCCKCHRNERFTFGEIWAKIEHPPSG